MANKKMVFMRWAAFVFILCNVLFSCTPVRAEALPPPVSVLPPETPQVHLWQHGQALVVTPQGAFATSNPVELGAGSALYDKLHQNYLAGQAGSPAGGGSATNPEGFRAAVNAGQALLTAEVPVGVTAPSGAAVAGAAAAAGVGVMAKAISVGAPLATTLAKGVLIGGAAVGAVFGSPILMGALMAASVGMTGYQLYQGLKGQGITGNPDGSASLLNASVPPVSGGIEYAFWNQSSNFVFGRTPVEGCLAFYNRSALIYTATVADNGIYNGGSVFGAHQWICTLRNISTGNYSNGEYINPNYQTAAVCPVSVPVYTYNSSTNMCEKAGGSSVTNEQMIAALLAATAAATVAADAANFALKNGATIPADTPLNSAPPAVVQSGWAEVKSLTDALNNNTSVQKRNIATIEQGQRYGDAPRIGLAQEERTVVNSAPSGSSITQLSTPQLSFSPNGVVSSSTDKPTPDLCQIHPEILACANLTNVGDVPDDVPLGTKEVSVSITPVSLSKVAVCPAPAVIPGMGLLPTYTISFQPACDQLGLIKPLMLLFAWIAAAMIVFVGRPYQS